eukprot:33330_1
MAQQQNELFSLNVRTGQFMILLKGINKNMTVGAVKALYFDEHGLDNKDISNMSFRCSGKRLNDDNKTLKYYGITNGMSPLTVVRTMRGGFQAFEAFNSSWTAMYERCPICVFKNRGNKNNLSKGYWHHPGSNQSYFVESKPSNSYIVEIKGNSIRCA